MQGSSKVVVCRCGECSGDQIHFFGVIRCAWGLVVVVVVVVVLEVVGSSSSSSSRRYECECEHELIYYYYLLNCDVYPFLN